MDNDLCVVVHHILYCDDVYLLFYMRMCYYCIPLHILTDSTANHFSKLEEQMRKKGSLALSVVQCLPFGPPRVGKTSAKNCLVGRKAAGKPARVEGGRVVYPDDVSESTGAVENVMKVDIYAAKLGDVSTFQEQDDQWIVHDFNTEVISLVSGIENVVVSAAPSSARVPMRPQHSTTVSSTGVIKTPNVVSQAFDISSSSIKPVMPVSKNGLTIYFTDAGGQPEFQDVLPALVAGPSLFLLVFGLAVGLDCRYEVRYDVPGSESKAYTSSFIVLDTMLQCLATIACIGSQRKDKVVKPKVFIIGTQRDLVTGEQVKQIDGRLQEAIKHHVGLKDLVEQKSSSQLIFAVNNYDENDDAFKDLRRAVKQVVQREDDLYRVKLPAPYVMLDFALRQPKKLTEEDCQEIAAKHNTTPEELQIEVSSLQQQIQSARPVEDIDLTDPQVLEDAVSSMPAPMPAEKHSLWSALFKLNELSHYRKPVLTMEEFAKLSYEHNIEQEDLNHVLWVLHHLLGTIRHFKDVPELKDYVITNPQLLFDVVTKLIASTFDFEANRQFIGIEAVEQFKKLGFFTTEDLEKIWGDKLGGLHINQMIALLVYKLIIGGPFVYNGRKYYFLPCVLNRAPVQQNSLPGHLIAPPLLIAFDCGSIPKGVFTCLVAYLIQLEEFVLDSDGGLFRDQASFILDCSYCLTICISPAILKFSLCGKEDEAHDDVCLRVRQVIEKGLLTILDRLSFKASYKLGHECTCGKGFFAFPKDSRHWMCTVPTNVKQNWFKGQGT